MSAKLVSFLGVLFAIVVAAPPAARAQSSSPTALVVHTEQVEGASELHSGSQALRGTPLGAELGRLVKTVGIEALSTPVSGTGAGQGALLEEARAQSAAVLLWVRSRSSSDGSLRATSLQGQKVSLQGSAVDVADGTEIWSGGLELYGYGSSAADARKSGLLRGWGKVREALESKLAQRFRKRSRAGSSLRVELRGVAQFRPASAILQRLAVTKGIDAMNVSNASRGRVLLDLDTALNAQSIAASLRRAKIDSGRFNVSVRGERIEVVYQPELEPGVPNG